MPEQEEQPAKKKRITVADLQKDLQELEQLIDENVLEVLVEHTDRLTALQTQITHGLDSAYTDLRKRVEALENGFLADAPPVWGEIDKRIAALEKAAKEKPDGAVTNVTDRLFALENATGALADAVKEIVEVDSDWGSQMEEVKDSIHSLQAAISDIQENATHTEPVPLPPPVLIQEKHIDPGALKAIAAVAQNMGDVLSMTRVLQTAGGLSDDEKRQIISIACQAAGVDYSENLLVRAGVRHFEA